MLLQPKTDTIWQARHQDLSSGHICSRRWTQKAGAPAHNRRLRRRQPPRLPPAVCSMPGKVYPDNFSHGTAKAARRKPAAFLLFLKFSAVFLHNIGKEFSVAGRGIGDGIRACANGLQNRLVVWPAGCQNRHIRELRTDASYDLRALPLRRIRSENLPRLPSGCECPCARKRSSQSRECLRPA